MDEVRNRYIDGEPGFLVVSGLAQLGELKRRKAFYALSLCLGRLHYQNDEGMEIKEVYDRGTKIGEGRTSWYSDSRAGGSLHTDGAKSAFPLPDYFTLFCVRPALLGGETLLVDARTVFARLSEISQVVVETLQQPFCFHLRGDRASDGREIVAKPVFFRENDRLAVTYLREYIESGHALANPLTSIQIQALNALDACLYDPALQLCGRLNPGELIIVNNKRIFHGRTAFEDGPAPDQKRLLLRIWLTKQPAIADTASFLLRSWRAGGRTLPLLAQAPDV